MVAPWPLEQMTEGLGPDRVSNVQDAFSKIPLIFRCVRLRCNTLRRVPIHVFENGKEVNAYPFEESLPLKDLVWLTEAALLLDGKSVSVVLSNEQGFDLGLQWLNPFTVTVEERFNDDGTWTRRFWQQVNGQRFPRGKDTWDQSEVYYVREFSVASEIGSGTAAAQVALLNGEMVHNVSRFLAQFFKGGAMPVSLLVVPSETKEEERKRMESFFKRAMTGVAKAFRVLAVNKDTELKTVTPEIRSFDVRSLDTHAIEAVSDAFDLPTSLIRGQAKTKAIADAERESFINDTIWARAEFHESALNKLLAPYGYSVDFALEEMPEMQENEEERSSAVQAYVNAGFSLAAACGILGVQVPDEFKPELELSARKKLQSSTEPSTAPTRPQNGNLLKADLEKWMKKALSRLRESKSANVDFESEAIPEELRIHLSKLLAEAKSGEQVKRVFADVEHLIEQ